MRIVCATMVKYLKFLIRVRAMMQDLYEGDLTEKMVVKQLTSPETSLISNSVEEFHIPNLKNANITLGSYSDKWYRQIHKATWIKLGMRLPTLDSCISSISASTNKRTRENYIDTVEMYGEGNWCYEFMHKGTELSNRSKQLIEENNLEEAYKLLKEANMAYSIASFPHLNGDKKAAQAQVANIKSFREILKYKQIAFKELEVSAEANGHKYPIKAWLLHLNQDEPMPMVLFAGSLENLFTDYELLYELLIKKLGCAVLCMDFARTGQNCMIPLDHDSSFVQRSVLDYVVEHVPIVDPHKIAAIGIRFGGNIVTRLSFMRSNILKCAIEIGPAINKIFTDKDHLDQLTQMQRAILCNKIDQNTANWDVCLPIFSQFSLKKQGLLGTTTKTPVKVIVSEGDIICDDDDAKLLVRSSTEGVLVKLKRDNFSNITQRVLLEIEQWLNKYFFSK